MRMHLEGPRVEVIGDHACLCPWCRADVTDDINGDEFDTCGSCGKAFGAETDEMGNLWHVGAITDADKAYAAWQASRARAREVDGQADGG